MPVLIDFSPLGNLGKTFVDAQDAARKRRLEEDELAAPAELARIYAKHGGMGAGSPSPVFAPNSAATAGPPVAPKLPTFAQGDAIGQYASAIQGNESGGNYQAVGPTHPKLGRALGAYQVMEANVGPWTREALGRELTPSEFLASPEAQDAVFQHKFGQSVAKYGNPQDAASVWFTGRPLAQGANAKDVLGTTGARYVEKFTAGLRRQGGATPDLPATKVAMPDASADLPAQGASEAQGFAVPGQAAQGRGDRNAAIIQDMLNSTYPAVRKHGLALQEKYLTRESKTTSVAPGSYMVDETGRVLFQAPEKTETQPDAVRQYEYARNQGDTRSFSEWKAAQSKAGASQVNVGGGSDKQIFDAVDESAKAARAAATGSTAIQRARQAVEAGGVFGAGADQRLGLQKLGAYLGVGDTAKIQNTETFRAAIAPQVGAILKATVGSNQISDNDRKFAEKAAGGDITLDEGSIRQLLDIMERGNQAVLNDHQQRLDAVYPDNGSFKRERAVFGVKAPPRRAPAQAAQPRPEPPAAPAQTQPDRAAVEAEMRRRGLLK